MNNNNSHDFPEISIPLNLETPDAKLFDETARMYAEAIAKTNSDNNKSAQIRRFYDELILWYERVGTSEEAFNNAKPFIYMMKSKVAYAMGRKLVDRTFKDYMDRLINGIKSINTLKNAKLFMEAMIGFYKFESEKNKNKGARK